MLLSLFCFSFIYSAAAAAVAEPPRFCTPERQRTGVQILHDTPNTALLKRNRMGRHERLQIPPDAATGARTEYLVYAALYPKEGSPEHLTLCRTIISEDQCKELSRRLYSCLDGSFDMVEKTSRFFCSLQYWCSSAP